MAINLHSKDLAKIAERFSSESYITGRLSKEFEFTGVKTVRISTPLTVPLNDYTRSGSNRYGTPVEMGDSVQEESLTRDRSFSLTIDKGNNEDQNGIKSAARMMALQVREQCVPEYDRYCFEQLAQHAGKINGDTKPTKSTIVERISAGTEYMDNKEVPSSGRTLFLTAEMYKQLRLSPEFLGVDNLAEKSLAKGQVGEYDGMPVVKVPASRFPANVNFMLVYMRSAIAPVKFNDTKIHKDPPGISGNLLEGRQYYDCFVLGAKADGVYVDVTTGSGAATICATPTQSSGTFASTTTGATFKYTADGTDPRYSKSAKVAASESEETGTEIKVYCYKDGCFPSEVLTYTA